MFKIVEAFQYLIYLLIKRTIPSVNKDAAAVTLVELCEDLSYPQFSFQMLLNVTLWENRSLVTYSALL